MDGKRKVTRSNYRWVAFKMKWLVPNWERAVGPAFWIYRLKEWWWYNMDPDNGCGKLHDVIEWWQDTAVKWLTPHLANARRLLYICVEDNGTKLLHETANYFYIRTRDENQYYFEGKVNLLGKVTITRTQWVDSKGDAKNLFLYGIVHGLCGKPEKEEEKPVPQTAEVFNGYVLTKRQLLDAVESVTRHEEFGWEKVYVAEEQLIIEIQPKNEWEFRRKLEKWVLKAYFQEVDYWFNLPDEWQKTFVARIENMDTKTAIKCVKEIEL